MSELAGAVAKRSSDRLARAMDVVMVHWVKIVDFMVVNEIGLIISVCVGVNSRPGNALSSTGVFDLQCKVNTRAIQLFPHFRL